MKPLETNEISFAANQAQRLYPKRGMLPRSVSVICTELSAGVTTVPTIMVGTKSDPDKYLNKPFTLCDSVGASQTWDSFDNDVDVEECVVVTIVAGTFPGSAWGKVLVDGVAL